jgi:dolichyl-phosphate beta-glucosyltransferase
VVVVNNASTDNTTVAAREWSGRIPNLVVLDEPKKGKGNAVRTGMLAARGRVRLFTDADNSTDISHFDKMRALFNQGYDVVICSRDAKDVAGATQAVPQAWHKRTLGNIGNLFIQLVAVPGIWDTQCGFKAFRRTAAERIFSAARIEKFGFDVENLALARRFGYRIGIVPAYWVNDAQSRVSLKSYLEVFWEVMRVRYYLLTGAYDERAPIRHESF